MAEEPADLTLELLRQIRAEQAAFRTMVEKRFEGVESDIVEMKRTMRGMTYMLANFTGRLENVATRVDHMTPT